jgi:hypothetical protein
VRLRLGQIHPYLSQLRAGLALDSWHEDSLARREMNFRVEAEAAAPADGAVASQQAFGCETS